MATIERKVLCFLLTPKKRSLWGERPSTQRFYIDSSSPGKGGEAEGAELNDKIVRLYTNARYLLCCFCAGNGRYLGSTRRLRPAWHIKRISQDFSAVIFAEK
jgi:hypothetical protein